MSAPEAAEPDPVRDGETDAAQQLWALLGESRLTPAQRRIAQYVGERPGQVASLGAGELAELTGVSQPSVSRFAKALGFEGFPALRRWLRRFVADHAREVVGGDERSRWYDAIEGEISNLRALQTWLSTQTDDLAAAGRLLSESPVMVVVGLRASAAVASHLGFFARKIHSHVRLVTEGGSSAVDALHESAEAGATATLIVALPRYPRETTTLAHTARQLGLSLVVMAESRLTAVAEDAAVVLPVKVGGRLVFDSQAAPMLLATALLDAIADAAPTRTQERLEEFERVADAFGHFERP